MRVYPCHLCGKVTNRRGRPFTEPEQTASHIDGSHDGKHKGVTGASQMPEIRDNGEDMDPEQLEGEQPRKAPKSDGGGFRCD